jgi:uncharacterized FAD-dependent dehydrogenase
VKPARLEVNNLGALNNTVLVETLFVHTYIQGLEYGEKALQVCTKSGGEREEMRQQVKDIRHLLRVTSSLKNHLQK